MSLDTDPTLYSYNSSLPDCLACFASGKTPNSLFCQLTGIKNGALWTPGDDPPPNGLYELNYSAGCIWDLNLSGVPSLLYRISPGLTIFNVTSSSRLAFNFSASPMCNYTLSNQLTSPTGNYYYGGWAQLINPLDDDPASLQYLMSLINLVPSSNLYCNPIYFAADETILKFYEKQGKTNIAILFDTS